MFLFIDISAVGVATVLEMLKSKQFSYVKDELKTPLALSVYFQSLQS